MNLILFEAGELERPLSREDPRAVHILTVLRRRPGEQFDVGLVDGPRGKATVVDVSDAGVRLGFSWGSEVAPLAPLALVVGLSRPQTMRRVLRDCTTIGVGELLFTRTEKSESSYAESSLWRGGEFRRHLIEGAEQAFTTRLPDVRLYESLAECLATIVPGSIRIALDNYEAPQPLAEIALEGALLAQSPPSAERASRERLEPVERAPADRLAASLSPPDERASGPRRVSVVLAIGSERGWSEQERELLRARGFALAHLGRRVQRTENACLMGATLLLARLGYLR